MSQGSNIGPQVCRFQEDKYVVGGKAYGTKWGAIWEHVGEQKRNLMRTHWELDGNNKNPKEKQLGTLAAMPTSVLVTNFLGLG
jgi:hypothetical protein